MIDLFIFLSHKLLYIAITLKHLVNKKKTASFPIGCTKCGLHFASEDHLTMHINHTTCNPNISWPNNVGSVSALRAAHKSPAGTFQSPNRYGNVSPSPSSGSKTKPSSTTSSSNDPSSGKMFPTPSISPVGSFSLAASTSMTPNHATTTIDHQAITTAPFATSHSSVQSYQHASLRSNELSPQMDTSKGYISVEISDAYQSGLGLTPSSIHVPISSTDLNPASAPSPTAHTATVQSQQKRSAILQSANNNNGGHNLLGGLNGSSTATATTSSGIGGNITIPTTNSHAIATSTSYVSAMQYGPQITIPTVGNSGLAYHVTSISNVNPSVNTHSTVTNNSNNTVNPVIPTVATMNSSMSSLNSMTTTTTNSSVISAATIPSTPVPTSSNNANIVSHTTSNHSTLTPHSSKSGTIYVSEQQSSHTTPSSAKNTPTIVIPLSTSSSTSANASSSLSSSSSSRKREIHAVDFHSTRQKRMKVIIPEGMLCIFRLPV
jgi:hypothetical protein